MSIIHTNADKRFDDTAQEASVDLLEQFWILREEEPEKYQRVREREHVLRTFFLEKMGLRLILHRHFAKLEKIPVQPESWMGIQSFQHPRDYALFCCLLAYLESRNVDEQFLLSDLTEELSSLYPRQDIDWTHYEHRKSLVRVLQFAKELGVVRAVDGDIERFSFEEEHEVLYEVPVVSRYFMRSYPKDLFQFSSREEILAAEWAEAASLQAPARRHRVYRQLFFSPALLSQGTDDADFQYVRRYRHRLREDVETHTDYRFELYKNVALLTMPEKKSKMTLYPDQKALSDIALQFGHIVRRNRQREAIPVQYDGTLWLTWADFESWVGQAREEYRDGWSKQYREASIPEIAGQLYALLSEWRMAAVDPETKMVRLELQLTYKDYVSCRQHIAQYEQSLEETVTDVDELQGEVNVLTGEVDTLELRLAQIEERLEELGGEEIRARMEQVTDRLDVISDELIHYTELQTNARNRMETLQGEVQQLEKELRFMDGMFRRWQDVFRRDLHLNLVRPQKDGQAEGQVEDQQTDVAYEGDEDALSLARQVLKRYGQLLVDANIDRQKRTDQLNKAFYKQQAVLVEYRLTQEDVLQVQDVPDPGDDEQLNMQVDQLRQKSRRIQMLMEYKGARVSPYYVMSQIENDIETQQLILTEKDRELYEEIIMNSVGRIIRARINRAQQWVKKINELMEERDTSSGLTFSIQWKPRTADAEEELDTRELVDLLRADARVLKEEDLHRVTRHFRSKIERAKEILEEKGYGETLHQAIKEILDYRKWFSFTLYYRRAGEKKKELTNNVFYTFSGGEKAMAMYIPLFSSAYSRYLEAREDAPYIISLDEAFAGVDENNIRDMFDLVEKLGFDYIMNSQAVWGDYDTVASLAIAELVRPKNAPYVTVVRYYWDGKARHLLHDEHVPLEGWETEDGEVEDSTEVEKQDKEEVKV